MSATELPTLRPASPACIDELTTQLGPGRVTIESGARVQASRDHSWLSPVLTEAIPDDAVADVVVTPWSVEELRIVLGLAHVHDAAVTLRGRGTGNYGQSVPLAGGIVVDLTAINGVLEVGQGWVEAWAGTSFTRLETAARHSGQELAMFPSTTNSALAGFLGGGAGGTGSIENGFIWDDFVSGLSILPCWDVPEVLDVDAAGALPHLHAYGTTGAVVTARVALRPAREWTAVIASFGSLTAAVETGRDLLDLDPPARNLSIDEAALVGAVGARSPLVADRASLRAVVEVSTVERVRHVVEGQRGMVEAVDPGLVSLCISLSYNHVTLRAKRADPRICHLQMGGAALPEHLDEVRAVLPGAMVHLDAQRAGGELGFGGLFLAPFPGVDELALAAQHLGDLGVRVVDPHTWRLGAHGSVDATVDAAIANDPKGLLNPGKLPR